MNRLRFGGIIVTMVVDRRTRFNAKDDRWHIEETKGEITIGFLQKTCRLRSNMCAWCH